MTNPIEEHNKYRHVTLAVKMQKRYSNRPANYIVFCLIDNGGRLLNSQSTRGYLSNFLIPDIKPKSKRRRTGIEIASDFVADLNHLGLKHGKKLWLTQITSVRASAGTQYIFQPSSNEMTAIYPYFGKDDADDYKMINALSTTITDHKPYRYNNFGDEHGANAPFEINVNIGELQNKNLISNAVYDAVKHSQLGELNSLQIAIWVNGELVQSEISDFKVFNADELASLLNFNAVTGFTFH